MLIAKIAAIGAVVLGAVLVVLVVSGVLAVIATIGSIIYRKVAVQNDSVALIISRLGNYFVSVALLSAVMFTNIVLMESAVKSGLAVPINYAIFGAGWFVLALLIPRLKRKQPFTVKAVLFPALLAVIGVVFDLMQRHLPHPPQMNYAAVQLLVLYTALAPDARFPFFIWGYTKLPD